MLERLPALRLCLGRDQVGEAFDCGEIHASVLERTTGELPGLGRPEPCEPAQRREGLAHVDFASKALSVWPAVDGDRVGEPIFVPRTPDAAEGDGWVLSVIYRGAEKRSDLAVFEATDVARGPVALVHLSHRVPAGFHGNWRPGPL